MINFKNKMRGIPTKRGKIYCPLQDRFVFNEAELGPRQFRNQRPGPFLDAESDFDNRSAFIGFGPGRGFGPGQGWRRNGRGWGFGRGWRRFCRW